MNEKGKINFWLTDPCELIRNPSIIPTKEMDINETLNSIALLSLIGGFIMWLLDYEYWYFFIIGAFAITIIIKIITEKKQYKEGFTIPPTYVDGASPMTTVPPMFAEEWQIPPPAYDVYNMSDANDPYNELAYNSQADLIKRPYPIYSQYLSDTTVLPQEEEELKNRPLRDAQFYMTDAITRDELTFRNDIIRPFVNRINREYKHGCFDQITPYSSW